MKITLIQAIIGGILVIFGILNLNWGASEIVFFSSTVTFFSGLFSFYFIREFIDINYVSRSKIKELVLYSWPLLSLNIFAYFTRFLDRVFKLKENKTSLRIEMVGGVTTFMTMSYIIFLQPAVLSLAGMDSGAVMVATCIASAVATLLMGLLAKYPFALAPAVGHNVFFAITRICRKY